MSDERDSHMKYVSLVVLTIQNAMLGLSMRYVRTKPGDMFLSSTAVLMSEIVKLVICIFVVFTEESHSLKRTIEKLNLFIVKQPYDTLMVGIPSFLYVIQNNLLYLSASNLDAATYQVTYQLKILTTAVFAVILLKRKLLVTQWISLVVLVLGIVSVQMADTRPSDSTKVPDEQNRLLGFAAALGACCLSGYAGIFFERVLKASDVSLWIRNVQLSFLSIPLGLFTTFVSDYSSLRKNGFFFGYDGFVIYVIILQAVGGLIVAMVVKYADNILKGFATSLAIIISCVASIYLFNFVLTFQFIIGVVLVISSVYGYNYKPPQTIAKMPV
ncbi:hypothetical protein RUM43_012144 [Polyplax serrata]|uniref:UDP-N-acetylglucosamine transporter n=1 Tax=Polyplax serrata TaxID=468196 RepID=A0AAN8P6D3_POLSC